MTATDELRRLLDERGVEWMDDSYAQLWCTVWYGQDGKQWRMTENMSGMLTELKAWHVTPEQAISATLGAEECTLESTHAYWDPYVRTSYAIELSCHTIDAWDDPVPPSYCPYCGKRVVREDE